MSEEPTTDRHRKPPRDLSISPTVVASLLSALVAGGSGSAATGWQVSGTMREGQLRMEARLDALTAEVRRGGERTDAAILRLEEGGRDREGRLRSLEIWRAQEEARRSGAPR